MRAHALYLPDASQPSAREAAQFASSAAPALRRRGIRLEAWPVRVVDLAEPRVLEAFRRRGVGSLPALIAEGRTLVGCREIEEFYAPQLAGPQAAAAPPEGDSSGDLLTAYFEAEVEAARTSGRDDDISGVRASD